MNESYFNNLVAFYYEIDADGKVNNFATHAPCGEWEIFEMAQGLAAYAHKRQTSRLFTLDQLQRLQATSAWVFDEKTGLSSAQLRMLMDLMNEIVHTNAIKPDKQFLCDLIRLGYTDELSEANIKPRFTPFYHLIWNRNSPRPAPLDSEPRQYSNGHDSTDLQEHRNEKWFHNNISFDNRAGKSETLMSDVLMRYALPANGFTPMPRIVLPAPQSPSRAVLRPSLSNGSPEKESPTPLTGSKRKN